VHRYDALVKQKRTVMGSFVIWLVFFFLERLHRFAHQSFFEDDASGMSLQ
jgi:hypothetical protein